jgi:sugar/nucleoside kinase (ribokinase family)
MTDITVIGDVNIDLLTSPIDSYPKEYSQILIPEVSMQIGGGSANFAFATSRLGMKTRMIGLLGKDIFGDYIITKAKEFKIESRLKQVDEKTGITLGVHFKDGTNSLFTFRGTNALLSAKNFRLEDVKGKAVHLAGYNFCDNLRKDVGKIVKYAKKKKMLVSLDPDIKSGIRFSMNDFRKFLKYVDILFVNMKEGEILTGKDEKMNIMKELLKFGCNIVALKCADKGCVVGSRRGIFAIKGIKVKTIDPTGVGDVFNAAFIFKYLKTKHIKESGIFANVAGAFAVTQFGEKRFPNKKEVEKFVS